MSALLDGSKPTLAAFFQGALSAGLLGRALFSSNVVVAIVIVFVAAIGAFLIFEALMSYMPGGPRNPLTAATIDAPQIGTKILVWTTALAGTLCVYGLALWLMAIYAGPFN